MTATKRRAALLVSAAVCVLGACERGPIGRAGPAGPSPGALEVSPIDVDERTTSLFDLGVADIDSDGNYDIWTINHSAHQLAALGDGQGSFRDVYDELGISQDVPGSETRDARPDRDEPGVYLWREPGATMLDATTAPPEAFPILVTMLGIAKGVTAEPADVAVTRSETPLAPGLVQTTLSVSEPVLLDVRPEYVAAPFVVSLADPSVPGFVGSLAVPVDDPVSLFLRDRHGWAWTDLDGDSVDDLIIVRGGLKGVIESGLFSLGDEVFLAGDDGFTRADQWTWSKEVCRSRAVEVVDVDHDAVADLHVTCKDGVNQVVRLIEGGSETITVPGLDLVDEGPRRWADLLGNRRADLIAIEGRRLVSFEAIDGGYRKRYHGRLPGLGVDSALHIGDVDGDRDLDVLIASPDGNRVALTGPNGFRVVAADELGLPAASRQLAFVDIDLDGALEVHDADGDIFRRVEGVFEPTWSVPAIAGDAESDGHLPFITWFDADGDGDRDLLTGVVGGELRLFEVELPELTWLHLDVRGPDGLRDAAGAVVSVVGSAPRQIHAVGGADGSRFSSGHRRVYLGIGDANRVRILVTWPDGTARRLTIEDFDRVHVIEPEVAEPDEG